MYSYCSIWTVTYVQLLQHLDSNLCTVTCSIWTVPYVQLLQHRDSKLCTVTCSIWTVTYVKLPAASGQWLMYSYCRIWTVTYIQLLQHLDSNFGWQIALHVCNYKQESWQKIQMEQPDRKSICRDMSSLSISYISGRHCIYKKRLAGRYCRIINPAKTFNAPSWIHAHSSYSR